MLIYYTIIAVLPIAFAVILSFTKWNGVRFDQIKWVGFANYANMFKDKELSGMFANTFLMGGLIMFFTVILSFFVALLMMLPIKLKGFFRTVWYIPCVVSTAVVSELVFTFINPSDGVINTILVGMGKAPVMWTLRPGWLKFWIIFISVWKGMGGTIILFLAGMSAVPQELYEAGYVDGVNKWQKLIHITLPCLRQMLAFIIITSSMGVLSIFEPVQLIARDQPSAMVIMYGIYNEAFVNFNVGMGSAMSVFVLALVIAVTLLNFKVTRIRI
ncbi:MAG: sugar ABC transporter permease [Clostridiales bacterium]|jgi:ABC-type sugar transport system permease subunit|nr:sugar ABC transporter permease [Clostridiales bacterium]